MTPCRAAPGPTPGRLGPAESHLCAPTAAQWQAGTQIQDTRGVTAPHAPGYPRRAIGVTPVTTSRESKAPRSPPGLGVLPPESGTAEPAAPTLLTRVLPVQGPFELPRLLLQRQAEAAQLTEELPRPVHGPRARGAAPGAAPATIARLAPGHQTAVRGCCPRRGPCRAVPGRCEGDASRPPLPSNGGRRAPHWRR